MTPGMRRGLVVLTAGALIVMGLQVADRSAVAAQVEAAELASDEWQHRLDAELAEHARLGETAATLRETTATYAALIEARQAFVAELGAASAAFAGASGKVDTTSQRAALLDLQQQVLVERRDVSVVTDAAGQAKGVASAVASDVADHDREQARLAAERSAAASRGGAILAGGGAGSAPSGGGGGYERVRAALDRVGGGGVPLQEFSGACGGSSAAACASSNGVISYSPGLASWPDGRLHWAMAHELAHIHQFRVWGSLMGSASYASLFGGNIELLANCMAAQRGHGSGNVSCSAAQIGFAGAIWSGGVPG